MKTFTKWLELREALTFKAWDDKRPLNVKIDLIRKTCPEYSSVDDDQLERILNFHTPEELANIQPDEAFDRTNNFQFAMDAGLGMDDDFNF